MKSAAKPHGGAPCPVLIVSSAAPDRPTGSMCRYEDAVVSALRASPEFAARVVHAAPPNAWLDRLPAVMRNPVRYAAIASRTRRAVRRAGGGVCHLLDGSHAYGLPVHSPARVVATVHDLIPLLRLSGAFGAPPSSRAGAWVVRRGARGLAAADCLIAVSGSTARDAQRLLAMPADRVRLCYNALWSADRVSPEPAAPRGDDRFVLHVGNNTFYKNRAGVVRIFSRLARRSGLRLVLAGFPPDKAVRREMARHGLESRVTVCVNPDDNALFALYRQAALFLFPSLYEGFGLPPLEAMFEGCPVVCSTAGPLPELVGDAALMADPHDEPAFAAQCARLLDDPVLAADMARRGREHAAGFTPARFRADLLACYRAAMAMPPRTP